MHEFMSHRPHSPIRIRSKIEGIGKVDGIFDCSGKALHEVFAEEEEGS